MRAAVLAWLCVTRLTQSTEYNSNQTPQLKIVLGCDWSWTVQSQRWPNLTLASYYSTHQDHMYNISVMKQLVAEANYRGGEWAAALGEC